MGLIVSVQEARKILGDDAKNMTDDQIIEVIQNLDAIAVAALRDSRERMKADALAFAELTYDIYQDSKNKKVQ